MKTHSALSFLPEMLRQGPSTRFFESEETFNKLLFITQVLRITQVSQCRSTHSPLQLQSV